MKLLWLTWRDGEHPFAGGAELVNEELAKSLARDGHEVLFLVGGFKGGEKEGFFNGCKVVRLGNRWTVYLEVCKYYRKNLIGWADLVIDEINTVPFFAKFYIKEKKVLFVHQLCREVWFYQMFFPLNLIGYFLEPVYLWLLRNEAVITVSKSTKKDLMRFGFNKKNIHIISEGIELEPVKNLYSIKKYNETTILSLGSIRSMKRTLHVVKAFEVSKTKVKDLKLKIVGESSSRYGKKVIKYIQKSRFRKSIEYLGEVSKKEKIQLMQKSHLACFSSVKEGWCLVVTEVNSQGTPAVVYNVDGLRDSVIEGKTGIVVKTNTPEKIAESIIQILKNKELYEEMQRNAYWFSKQITFDNSYSDFLKTIKRINEQK